LIGLQDGLVEYRTHFRWAVILICALLLVLVGRLFHLQIVKGRMYETLATVSHVVRERTIPPRGSIFDRNGKLLATDVEVSDLVAIPHNVTDPQAAVEKWMSLGVLDAAEAADALEKIIDGRQGARRFHSIVVKRNLVGTRCPNDLEPLRFDAMTGQMVCSRCGGSFVDQKAVVQAHLHEMKGFSLHSRMVRHYPAGAATIHAVGYVNEVTAAEVDDSNGVLKPGDVIGRSGLEKALDEELRGKVGEDVYVRSAAGSRIRPADLPEPFKDLKSFPPVPGRSVKTTLELGLQKAAVAALKPHRSGAIVVMDVDTGEILAMASQPTFELGPRLTVADREPPPLQVDYAPMMNKAVSSFPPGSTFKVVTALAGLMEGVIDSGTRTDCPGYYEYRNRKFRCFVRSGHGEVDLVDSLAQSCDTYYYRLGDLLGIDTIARYATEMFGLGQKTGIEISENPGVIPTEAWYLNSSKGYQPGFAINASVGQGDIRTSPLSMARAYAVLANGGRIVQPRLTAAWIDPDTGLEEPVATVVGATVQLHDRHRDLIERGLYGAVNTEAGTAYASRIRELPYSGKTGTAEAREYRKDAGPELQQWLKGDHAWFVALAPARRPRIAVAVFLEHAGFGGAVAAPAARKVIEAYYREHADEFIDLWEGFDSRPELEIVHEGPAPDQESGTDSSVDSGESVTASDQDGSQQPEKAGADDSQE